MTDPSSEIDQAVNEYGRALHGRGGLPSIAIFRLREAMALIAARAPGGSHDLYVRKVVAEFTRRVEADLPHCGLRYATLIRLRCDLNEAFPRLH
jgi:hypothetical protein